MHELRNLLAVLALIGISFSADLTSCSVLTAPGTYTLANDLAGAPNFVSFPTPAMACLQVTGSNILLDCKGHAISNDGIPPNTFGVIVQGTNITVENCVVSNYTWGVDIVSSQGSVLSNVSSVNNSQSGIALDASSGNSLSGNAACMNGGSGFVTNQFLSNSFDNNLTGNTACGNGAFGFQISGIRNNLEGNDAHGNAYSGFTSGPFNTLVNNTAYDHPQIGFIAGNDNVTSNTAFNNSGAGFLVSGSGSTLSGNTAYNNTDGFDLSFFSSGNSLTGNAAHDNSVNGFDLFASSGNTLFNDTSARNMAGFMLEGVCPSFTSDLNRLDSADASGNLVSGITVKCGSGNSITSSIASGNGVVGFNITGGSRSNTLGDDVAFNNTGFSGFLLDSSSSNSITNGTAYGNNGGIALLNASGNSIRGSTSFGNPHNGFFLNPGNTNNVLAGNTAYGNGFNGFVLAGGSNGNTLSNNTAFANGFNGFRFTSSNGNTVTKDAAYGNALGGFNLTSSSLNTLTANFAFDNGHDGLWMSGSDSGNLLFRNELCRSASFDIEQKSGSGNSGQGNICDTSSNWNDMGAAGCTYTCVPVTSISYADEDGDGVPNAFSLSAFDTDGVNQTFYSIDGGPYAVYNGTVPIPSGNHTISYYSTDILGMVEPVHTVQVVGDGCPGSVLDPIQALNPRQYGQVTGFGWFEAGPQNDTSMVYSQAVTRGCTCSQIAVQLGAGLGSAQKGCSRDLMENWTGVSAQPDWDAGIGKAK